MENVKPRVASDPTDQLILLTIPGLRPGDVCKSRTPTLYDWANTGVLAELIPTFPCVTSPVQASMMTGSPPGKHGVIANGFFYRDRREVEFWVAPNMVIEGEQIWSVLRESHSGRTSAVWHAQNIKQADADFIVTPAPIHEDDGSTKLWCYSKPDGLYQQLIDDLGHFPLQHYWGPLSNIESTRWILRAAAKLVQDHRPNFHWIYIPHLDYAAQKHGPNSEQALAALTELDELLGDFANRISQSASADQFTFLVAGEYALTDVSGVIYPNRLLRETGLFQVRDDAGKELVDFERSAAFAMVDHQLAHIYITQDRPQNTPKCVELFSNLPGVARVLAGDNRAELGMDHERCGDVILVCEDDHWLAYYWWLDAQLAPDFARTVDIHRKPGYDPVELFFDPATRSIPLTAELVKGSHGVPATAQKHKTALICSTSSNVVKAVETYRDTDMKEICLALLKQSG